MATRGWGNPGTRALSGVGRGIADFGDELMKTEIASQGEQRRANLAMIKDLEDKVAAGSLEPEQANAIVERRGLTVPPNYFEGLQPTHEHQLRNIMMGMAKASSPQEVPGPQALGYMLPGGPKNAMSFGAQTPQPTTTVDQETGQETLPATPLGPIESPEFKSLLNARQEKIAQFPATAVANTDAEGNPITEYRNPTTLTGLTTRPQPTAQQKGHLSAVQALTQQTEENQGGLPGLKGEAYKQEHLTGELSPEITKAKGKQEAAIETQKGYARLAVEGSPQALEVRRRQQQVDADVKQAAAEAGLAPDFAENFLHHGSFGSYMFIDPGVPQEQRKYVYKIAAQAAQKNGLPIRFVNKEQENALSLIERAYTNYTYIADVMAQFAAKNATSRIVGAPANTLAAAMQTNPQLAAMVTDLPAAMEAAGAQMTGVRGLRMGKELIDHLKNTVPLPTDSLATIRYKQIQQAQFLRNAAESILK